MTTALVLQARFGSQRLPGKALLPFGRTTVLESAAKRALKITADSYWFVTSKLPEDDALAEICKNLGLSVIRGDVDDVLSRFESVVRMANPTIIIRATGDNPLISYELANKMVREFKIIRKKIDSLRPSSEWPIGLLPEVFNADSLKQIRVGLKESEKYHLSHVTSRLDNIGNIKYFPISNEWSSLSNWRLTLDELEDYELFSKLSEIYAPKIIEEISSADLIDLLKKNSSFSHINSMIRQKLIEEG